MVSDLSQDGPKHIFVLGGWGCDGAWLGSFCQALKQMFQANVEQLDLPGYHKSSDDSVPFEKTFEDWEASTLLRLQGLQDVLIIGWSYGGMLALRLSQKLSSLPNVITLGSRPKFIDDECTVFDEQTANHFLERVQRSASKGLSYFIALTGKGEPKVEINSLKSDIALSLPARDEVLVASLRHLYALDVSTEWNHQLSSGQLFDVYFSNDSLIKVTSQSSLLFDGGHLSPVIESERLAKFLLGLCSKNSSH